MNAFTAGCRTIEISDRQTGEPVPTIVLYPCSLPEQPEKFGPYTLRVAMNAAIATGMFPLVVISHGTGSSQLVFRNLAAELARNGFAVLLPEHPRNNRNNNELAGTAAILTHRPGHISSVIDWAFSTDGLGPSLAPDTVTVLGHSLGGYTGLALAGGVPTAFPHETPDRESRTIEVVPDRRVRALILFAPAAAWFMAPGSLNGVRVPILMLTAEKDPHTPAWHGDLVLHGVPDKSQIDHRVVANAGHFSFLSPFPDSMTKPAFKPSQDPPGFDRERFQVEMKDQVLAFLARVVGPPA